MMTLGLLWTPAEGGDLGAGWCRRGEACLNPLHSWRRRRVQTWDLQFVSVCCISFLLAIHTMPPGHYKHGAIDQHAVILTVLFSTTGWCVSCTWIQTSI